MARIAALAALLLGFPGPAPAVAAPEDADLALTVSTAPETAGPGGVLTYTFTVTNAGPAAAAAVRFDTVTPTDTEFATFTAPPGWLVLAPPVGAHGTVRATRATLAAGGTGEKFVLAVTVTGGGRIDLNTRVSALTPEPNPANNSANTSTPVQNAANLSVTVSDGPDPVPAGAQLTYTITVANAGPAVAVNPSLSVATPAHTVLAVPGAPNGWRLTEAPSAGGTGTIRATTGGLRPGAKAEFRLIVTVQPDSADTAQLTLNPSTTSDTPDPDTANNSVTATTTVANAADLGVSVVDTPDPVVAGGTITYSLTLDNNGPTAAANAAVSADIPAGTTFASLTGPAGWTTTTPSAGGSGAFAATATSLPSGSSATFTLTVTAGTATVVTLTVKVSATTADPAGGNDSDTVTTAVVAAPASAEAGSPGIQGISLGGSSMIRLAGVTIVAFGLLVLVAAMRRRPRRRRY